MHVLPLPFGFALALIPRREFDQLRRRGRQQSRLVTTAAMRERIPDDIRWIRV